jgi:hypothetical protein
MSVVLENCGTIDVVTSGNKELSTDAAVADVSE